MGRGRLLWTTPAEKILLNKGPVNHLATEHRKSSIATYAILGIYLTAHPANSLATVGGDINCADVTKPGALRVYEVVNNSRLNLGNL